MPFAANSEQPYQVRFSGVIAEAIRHLQRSASHQGRGPELLLALGTVVEQLRRNPIYFGEPLYRMPALQMQLRCAVVHPLYVDFAVCEDRPLVFIKRVKLLLRQRGARKEQAMPRTKKDDIPRLVVPKNATLRQIYAIARKEFTAADLQKFTEIEPMVPMEHVLAEMETIHEEESRKQRNKQ